MPWLLTPAAGSPLWQGAPNTHTLRVCARAYRGSLRGREAEERGSLAPGPLPCGLSAKPALLSPAGTPPLLSRILTVKLERLLETIRPAPPFPSWVSHDPRLSFPIHPFWKTNKQTNKHLVGAFCTQVLFWKSELWPPVESSLVLIYGSPLWVLPGHTQSLSVPLTPGAGSWTPRWVGEAPQGL